MSRSARFAIVCLLLWGAFLLAALVGIVPRPMVLALALPIFALWLLHRRGMLAEDAKPERETERQAGLVGRVCFGSSEVFSFSIEPNGNGSYGLCLRLESGGLNAMARIGNWSNIEKAQRIAERIARQLSDRAQVVWHHSQEPAVPQAAE